MLSAHRAAVRRQSAPRPLPSVECNSLAPVKRIVASSDAVTGTILSCIRTELEAGQLVLLTREPWLHLQYGVVSLKGLPRTQVAERFLDYVMEAERETVREEEELTARFALGRRKLRTTRS
jgi:DNA-binding transcriptional LysR family regulator